jgi:hypothetical protein
MARGWLTLLALVAAGCGVSDRQALVGRYQVPATGETWTLEDDGSCRIERGRTVQACEWVYREDEEGTRLIVTVAGAAGGPAPHKRTYVLAPSKSPGRPITIPLSRSATLEKRDGPATR